MTEQIHPSATIGEGFEMGFNCIIGENVTVGSNVKIGNMCVIEANTVVGDDVSMDHFCIIGTDCIVGPRTRFRSNVEIRTKTEIGSDCYIDSGVKSSGLNRVGNEVTLRYDAIIARGCDIGDRTYICPQVMTNNLDHNMEQVGGAKVGEDCFIGTNTTLGAGILIAAGSIVGSKAMVTKDIDERGVYIGVPAKLVRSL